MKCALDTEQRLPIDSIENAMALARSSVMGKAIVSQIVWLAMRRYMYKPLELTKGCESSGNWTRPGSFAQSFDEGSKRIVVRRLRS
jgi:hypothetical protein